MYTKRGQTFSLDLIIGSVVFIVLLIIFLLYSMSNVEDDQTKINLEQDASVVVGKTLTTSRPTPNGSFIVGNTINSSLLASLTGYTYAELKSMYGSRYDFCMYFEDNKGDLIDLDTRPEYVQYSIGSPTANFSIFYADGRYKETLKCGESKHI